MWMDIRCHPWRLFLRRTFSRPTCVPVGSPGIVVSDGWEPPNECLESNPRPPKEQNMPSSEHLSSLNTLLFETRSVTGLKFTK